MIVFWKRHLTYLFWADRPPRAAPISTRQGQALYLFRLLPKGFGPLYVMGGAPQPVLAISGSQKLGIR
jgi:hypothetical protein